MWEWFSWVGFGGKTRPGALEEGLVPVLRRADTKGGGIVEMSSSTSLLGVDKGDSEITGRRNALEGGSLPVVCLVDVKAIVNPKQSTTFLVTRVVSNTDRG
jgi:hypothetical protein